MERPDIKLIKESLPYCSERIAKGTVTHLLEYIEALEEKLGIETLEKMLGELNDS